MAAFGLGMKRLTHKHSSCVSETLRSQTIRCSEDMTMTRQPTAKKKKDMNAKTQNDKKKVVNVNNREVSFGERNKIETR